MTSLTERSKVLNCKNAHFVNSFVVIKVAVGPKQSTNRNLKEIITIECTKTVILQLLWPLDISKLAERESLYNHIS